jgi:hypothetical protein
LGKDDKNGHRIEKHSITAAGGGAYQQAFRQVMKKIKALAEFMGQPVDDVG